VYSVRSPQFATRSPVFSVQTQVVLVDERDTPLGTLGKAEAHREGLLHRAISVIVLNRRGETLLQQRASDKYHSGGQWANACCSHPLPGESVAAAARRRLAEEMGIDVEVAPAFVFTYRAEVGDGLVEHEYDHVFVARWEGDPTPDPAEVEGWRGAPAATLPAEAARTPEAFAPWFRMMLARPDWHALTGFAHTPG
jgi:isopentenyl-diphosphate Delta-isomerase